MQSIFVATKYDFVAATIAICNLVINDCVGLVCIRRQVTELKSELGTSA